ncbi:hypothetical protein TCAL_01192 [Tigriopus californicus]|uniref:Uncharacterized protein n=1 Tax=Tigriopus californicus TaxID=6832 RepID=A0A553NXF5_TIGCA|nr:hypothetical protein TCAL_01192 [Tigriopus californicus]|eukprot:TCALIF_01192-PA protein Name:"Protein of unknown function" AED:0.77 eAED:0.77 QI:0/-1/0/1/-1/1/1/0/62
MAMYTDGEGPMMKLNLGLVADPPEVESPLPVRVEPKPRRPFDPSLHGLDPKFRLTNFADLKG